MLKDCIVTLNINGIPRSFSLRGVSDNVSQDIESELRNEIESGSFSDTPYGNLAKEIMEFYKKTLPKEAISGNEIAKHDSEVLDDSGRKDNYNKQVYNGLEELSYDYPEISSGIESLISEIGMMYGE